MRPALEFSLKIGIPENKEIPVPPIMGIFCQLLQRKRAW